MTGILHPTAGCFSSYSILSQVLLAGPNSFCWIPICSVGSDLRAHFKVGSFQPKTYADVNTIIERLKQHEAAIKQYLANIQYGVKAGMVRAKEDCEAGMYALRRKFVSITQNGSRGILVISMECAPVKMIGHPTFCSVGFCPIKKNERFA